MKVVQFVAVGYIAHLQSATSSVNCSSAQQRGSYNSTLLTVPFITAITLAEGHFPSPPRTCRYSILHTMHTALHQQSQCGFVIIYPRVQQPEHNLTIGVIHAERLLILLSKARRHCGRGGRRACRFTVTTASALLTSLSASSYRVRDARRETVSLTVAAITTAIIQAVITCLSSC